MLIIECHRKEKNNTESDPKNYLEKRHAKLSSDLVRVITSYESARKINGKLEVEKLELLAKVHRLENEVDAYHKALTNKKEPVGAR